MNGLLHKTYTVESDPGVLNYSLNEGERGKTAFQLFDDTLFNVGVRSTLLQDVKSKEMIILTLKLNQYTVKKTIEVEYYVNLVLAQNDNCKIILT